MGIWIHDKVIEFVRPETAAKLYEEYDGIDRKMFSPYYYGDYAMDQLGRGLLEKCLEVYGIDDADEFIKDAKQRRLLDDSF